MTRWYLDTSAAAKLMVAERISCLDRRDQPFTTTFDGRTAAGDRAASDGSSLPAAQSGHGQLLLTKVSLYLIEPAQFTHAGLLPGQNLRSLDVLHLAAATDLGVDALVTYDQRLQSAAHGIGMSVVAPS